MTDVRSRYAKGTIATVDHPIEGRVQIVTLSPLRWNQYPYTRYQTTVADSLTALAWRAYGRAQDWWFIAAMNPQIEHPDDLTPGGIIQVPTGKNW